MSGQRFRVGVWASHPIQYAAPWFRHLATAVDLEVFYAHRQTAAGQAAAGFGVEFEWDIPLLDGYRYRWLDNVAPSGRVSAFAGCDTPEIASIVAGSRFDAFVVFGWNHRSAVQTVHACRRHGVAVLMRGDSHLGTPRPALTRAMKRLAFGWALDRWVDAHLYVGRRNREYLEHYGVPGDRLFFTPHAVDNEFFAAAREGGERSAASVALRSRLGIPPEAFVFVFVGKLLPVKRVHDLLHACRRLWASGGGGDVRAVIVGDGPQRASLERQAAACGGPVHFLGFRNQGELPAVYGACDALVLPSESETWGLVVNEAAAAGLPAVVSDGVGSAADLIVAGRTGFSYPVADVGLLADRMLALKHLCQVRGHDVRASLREMAATYSYDTATAGLLQAVEAVTWRSAHKRVAANG
jgi:glycosyltransferase involved in cell wall biosynthesis